MKIRIQNPAYALAAVIFFINESVPQIKKQLINLNRTPLRITFIKIFS